MRSLTQKAIESALVFDWEHAADYNLAIIQQDPTDLQALNRLAKSYLELGQQEQAKDIYKQVLKLDKYNTVALKNLKLLPQKNGPTNTVSDEDFIEEAGITKTVRLIKLASRDIITTLYCKQPVQLTPKTRLVRISTEEGEYIGSLPDDLSFILIKLMIKSYSYQVCVKSISPHEITVFIRETRRGKRGHNTPSFSNAISYQDLKK